MVNVGAFLLFNLILGLGGRPGPLALDWLALSSWGVLHGRLWELVTYMFLHGGFFHLLINMLYLFMFGSSLERAWGRRFFFKYYMVTGVGAALVWVLVQHGSRVPTLGASGAVFAILLAFGMMYPNSTLLLFFVLPVKAKYLVAALIGFEVIYAVQSLDDGIAHLIHLAGAGIGYIYLRHARGSGVSFPSPLKRFRRWRMRRRLQVIDYRELMKFDDEDDRPTGKGTRH